jgi:hypothetical protein
MNYKQNHNHTLPWDEIIDRLYHRQEPELIAEDLLKREMIHEGDLPNTIAMISDLKERVQSFRLKQ